MPVLTLVSFNAHYGLQPFRRDAGPYDQYGVLASFGEPDVLVVQEVWRPDGTANAVDGYAADHGYALVDVACYHAQSGIRWPRPDPQAPGTVSVAVLSRLPVEVLDRPAVGPTPGDVAPLRRVLHTEVTVDGVALDLVAVHLSSRLPHAPPIQLRRLARLLPPPGRPGIVAGDCNFWGPPTEALLPGWHRAVRGRTWPAHRPHSQIDHVLTRGAVTVLDTRVLGNVGSDHRPVRVTARVG